MIRRDWSDFGGSEGDAWHPFKILKNMHNYTINMYACMCVHRFNVWYVSSYLRSACIWSLWKTPHGKFGVAFDSFLIHWALALATRLSKLISSSSDELQVLGHRQWTSYLDQTEYDRSDPFLNPTEPHHVYEAYRIRYCRKPGWLSQAPNVKLKRHAMSSFYRQDHL